MRAILVWAAVVAIAVPLGARAGAPVPAGAPADGAAPGPAAGSPETGLAPDGKAAKGSTQGPQGAPPDRVAAELDTAGRKKKGRAIELSVKGRVYVDLAMDERDDWNRDLALGSARIALEGRIHGVLTVLEAELASRSPVRDAFVRLDGPRATRLHAGRFKAPFSVRELESSWRLPLVTRGLVNDFVVDRNELGGRRVGAMASMRPWSGRLEVDAGVFTAPPGTESDRTREDLAGAVFYRVREGIEVGATGYRRNASTERRDAGTAHLDVNLGPFGATVEGMAGHLREGPFTAATAVASWDFRVGRSWLAGPVLGAEGLRLRDGEDGVGWAAIVGAVLHHTEGLKVKLEGERARRPGDDVPRNAVVVQLGTRF